MKKKTLFKYPERILLMIDGLIYIVLKSEQFNVYHKTFEYSELANTQSMKNQHQLSTRLIIKKQFLYVLDKRYNFTNGNQPHLIKKQA